MNIEKCEDSNVEKPRARRKKAESCIGAASLIKALKFISPAQKKMGSVNQQFCFISNNKIIASNCILTIGTKIEEDLNACPHTFQMLDALSKCKHEFSITQLSSSALCIKSDKFNALIPCVNTDALEISQPDEKIADVDDRIKLALDAVARLATDGAQEAVNAAVLLQSGSAVATNGYALAEYWHGLSLPPLLIPKVAASAVADSEKNLVGIGFSAASATFWFSDESFIKTQLFAERYINYANLFEVSDLNPWPLPDDFFKAVHAVHSFSRDGVIYFENGFILSKESETQSASFKIEGLPEKMGFQAKYLLMLERLIEKVHFDKNENRLFFFGENVRGVIMGVAIKKHNSYNSLTDDDIPF